MAKSLFNKYEAWTEEAQDIGGKIRAAIRPIIEKAVEDDCLLRELHVIAEMEVSGLICEMIVKRAIYKRRAEREAEKKADKKED